MGNLVSSVFGGGTTQQQSNTAPWSTQQPYLQSLFSQGANIYNQRSAAGPYTGSFYSPQNPTQAEAQNQAAAYGSGPGAALAATVGGTSMGLQGAAAPFVGNAAGMATNGATSGTLSGALNGAALNGVNTLGAIANPSDPTARLSADAGSYMASAPVQGAVNSTNAQIGQTLNETTLPGLDRAAAMGGTLDSSRAGAADAQAREGAGLAEGAADSSILNNAWNTGLGTAATEYNTGQANALTGANSELGANLGVAGLNAQTQLGANAQLGTAAGLGVTSAGASGALAGDNYTLGAGAGGAQQQDANNQLQNLYQQWQMQNGYGQNILQQYAGDVTGNYGGSSTGSTTAPSNVVGSLAGLGVLAGTPTSPANGGFFGPNSIYGSLFGSGSSTPAITGWAGMAA